MLLTNLYTYLSIVISQSDDDVEQVDTLQGSVHLRKSYSLTITYFFYD